MRFSVFVRLRPGAGPEEVEVLADEPEELAGLLRLAAEPLDLDEEGEG